MLRRTIAFLPFALPFVAYGFYFLLARRKARADGTIQPSLVDAPWVWIVIAGFGLLVISLVGFAISDGRDSAGPDVPSRIAVGRSVPGAGE